MKNYIATIAATALMMIVLFGIESSAQAPSRVIATIPFEFSVGDTTLPAGRYEFKTVNRQTYPGSLVIRSMDGPEDRSVMVGTLASDEIATSDNVGLLFNRYGASHFLSSIELRASDLAVRFKKSKAERGFEKQQARRLAILVRPGVASAGVRPLAISSQTH